MTLFRSPPQLAAILAVPFFLVGCAMPVISHKDGDFEADKKSALPYALPRGHILLGIAYDGKGKLTVTGPTVQYLPDPKARFWLEMRGSPTADDTISLATDTNGLLSTVNSKNKDVSPQIVTETASIVTDLLLSRARAGLPEALVADEPLKSFDIQLAFDPTDPRETNMVKGRVNKILKKFAGSKASLEILSMGYRSNASVASVLHSPGPDRDGPKRSVYFRTLRPIGIRLNLANLRFDKSYYAVIPDEKSLAAYDITRKACVESSTNLTFSNGVLNNAELIKPSQVLGCLAIPSSVIKAVLGFPTLFADRQKELTQAEFDLLKVQMELAELQAQITASNATTQ